MKKLLAFALAALCFNSLAVTPTALITPSPMSVVLAYNSYIKDQKKVYYIKVQSQAEDFEKAKKQAFRLASEQVTGTVVLSESELHDSKLTRNEIVTYSSGIVDEYKIVERYDSPGAVKLVMDIWIAKSAMANRVLAKSATENNIQGDTLGTRVASIVEERQRGDQLIKTIIQDIPRRSFRVKTETPVIRMDSQRTTWATVRWEVAWDQQFLAAFAEAAKETGQPVCWWRCPATQMYYIQGFGFEDNQKHKMIVQYIDSLSLVIMFEVLDIRGRPVARACESLHDGTLGSSSVGRIARLDYGIVFLSSESIKRQTHINFGTNPAAIAQVDQIRAEIVPGQQCRPF